MFFRRGLKNIKVRIMQAKAPSSPLLSICVESVNMLEGLTEEEAEQYFVDHTDIIPPNCTKQKPRRTKQSRN